jgi:hypothetical protein
MFILMGLKLNLVINLCIPVVGIYNFVESAKIIKAVDVENVTMDYQ